MLDYINENTFEDIAHHSINSLNINNTIIEILKNSCIIYCDPKFLNLLFNKLNVTNNKYILISPHHISPIDGSKFKSKPLCIKTWFVENATYIHPDIVHIPVGLVPSDLGSNKNLIIWFSENIEILKSNTKNMEILYCNWRNDTNPTIRLNVIKKLKKNGLKYLWDRDEPEDSLKNNSIIFKEYCNNLSKHKYIVSPPGDSPDCHRTWESLYMGCIPIVLKHNIYKEYGDLPIIQVNDYSEVTYDLLYSYLYKEYNYEKLYMSYWKKRITEEFNSLNT